LRKTNIFDGHEIHPELRPATIGQRIYTHIYIFIGGMNKYEIKRDPLYKIKCMYTYIYRHDKTSNIWENTHIADKVSTTEY